MDLLDRFSMIGANNDINFLVQSCETLCES